MFSKPNSYYRYHPDSDQEADYFRDIRLNNLDRLFDLAKQIAQNNQSLATIDDTIETDPEQIANQFLVDIAKLTQEFADDPDSIDLPTRQELSSDPILILEVLLKSPRRIDLFSDQIQSNPELAFALKSDPRIKSD
ncbi:hypothetical protein KC853_00120 [Candidatus Saccharibacteria bacterium]|nr:hypothetical protein [Candidatus Saccharibacteria bacterium]MCB9834996.1 hypothetical protein [Candidatus Nomurabacteria bacterium]